MGIDAVAFVSTIFSTCRDWFVYLLGVTGTTPIYLVAVFYFLVGRFLLSPIFGTAIGVSLGSDIVTKKRSNAYRSSEQKKLKAGK